MQKAEKQCLEETSPCWGFTLSYHMIQYDMLRHDMMCNMHIDNVVKYNVSAESDNRTLYSVHAVATILPMERAIGISWIVNSCEEIARQSIFSCRIAKKWHIFGHDTSSPSNDLVVCFVNFHV